MPVIPSWSYKPLRNQSGRQQGPVSPATEGQGLCEGKVSSSWPVLHWATLLQGCCPTFLLPMWWLPHSGKVREMSDLNSCPGVLLHLGYDKCEAVLNVRADYPAKAPFRMDKQEVWQSTGAYKILLQLK